MSSLCELFLTIAVFYWLSYFITGVSSPSLVLTRDFSEQTILSKRGFRHNQDKIVFHATLDTTGIKLMPKKLVYFEIRQDTGQYLPVCGVSLDYICNSISSRECYCSSKNGHVFELVYNRTADISISSAGLRVSLKTESKDISSNELQMPLVYDSSCPSLTLTMNRSEQITPCSDGFRHEVDKFVFRGTLNATGIKLESRKLVSFEIRQNTGEYLPACSVSLNTCNSSSGRDCYCSSQNGQVFQLIYNRTAEVSTSGSYMRIHMNIQSGKLDSNELQIPAVYDSSCPSLTLTMNRSEQITPCSDGFRHNLDKFVFRGTLNATGIKLESGKLVSFEIRQNTGEYLPACSVSLNTCNSSSGRDCYCSSQNGQVFQLIYNRTAEVSTSGSYMRIHMNIQSGKLDSNELQIPAVYDKNVTKLNVTVSNRSGNNTYLISIASGSCHSYYKIQEETTLTFCCSNFATTCHPRISVKGNVVASQPECVSYSFTPQQAINLSYSLCSQSSEIIYLACEIKPETASSVTDLIQMWLIGMSLFVLCLLGVAVWKILTFLKEKFVGKVKNRLKRLKINSARKTGQDNQDAETDSEKKVIDPLLQQEMTSSGFQACNRTETDGSTMETAL